MTDELERRRGTGGVAGKRVAAAGAGLHGGVERHGGVEKRRRGSSSREEAVLR